MRHLIPFIVAAVTICTPAAASDLMPLTSVPDETGFGTLYDDHSSSYSGSGFAGALDSRVYVDAAPPNTSEATFVFDLQVDQALTVVENMTIAATGTQDDLRIGEIIGGTNGYVSATTTNPPDSADAINNVYPTVDELIYGWVGDNRLLGGERATLFVTTTGSVDVGLVSAAIQDGGVGNAVVLAPVDDPESPDLPEPATMALLGIGGLGLLIRRRR